MLVFLTGASGFVAELIWPGLVLLWLALPLPCCSSVCEGMGKGGGRRLCGQVGAMAQQSSDDLLVLGCCSVVVPTHPPTHPGQDEIEKACEMIRDKARTTKGKDGMVSEHKCETRRRSEARGQHRVCDTLVPRGSSPPCTVLCYAARTGCAHGPRPHDCRSLCAPRSARCLPCLCSRLAWWSLPRSLCVCVCASVCLWYVCVCCRAALRAGHGCRATVRQLKGRRAKASVRPCA